MRCRSRPPSCRRRILQPEAVRKPRLLRSAKHRVELRVRASTAAWSRDEAFLKVSLIVAADKSGGTPARLPRGPPQRHRARPSFVCSSQVSLENCQLPSQEKWYASFAPSGTL